MERDAAVRLLDRLHTAQNSFYAGGGPAGLRAVLAADITWHVPGRSRIAGTYQGFDDVVGYFTRRRGLAAATFRITRRDVLTGAGDTIAALTDGAATLAGAPRRWSTVGLYRTASGLVAECWLMPTDPDLFDEIWS